VVKSATKVIATKAIGNI